MRLLGVWNLGVFWLSLLVFQMSYFYYNTIVVLSLLKSCRKIIFHRQPRRIMSCFPSWSRSSAFLCLSSVSSSLSGEFQPLYLIYFGEDFVIKTLSWWRATLRYKIGGSMVETLAVWTLFWRLSELLAAIHPLALMSVSSMDLVFYWTQSSIIALPCQTVTK